MSELLKDLRSLSDEEIIERHDREAERTVATTNHYLSEIVRRDQARQTVSMLSHTKSIKRMTVAITVFTIINVLVAIALMVKAWY